MIYREIGYGKYIADGFGTLRATGGNNGGGSETLILDSKETYGVVTKGNGEAFTTEGKHTSLTAGGGQAGQGFPCILTNMEAYTIGNGQTDNLRLQDKAGTLNCMHDPQIVFHTTQDPISSDSVSPCISTGNPKGQATVGVLCAAVAYDCRNNAPNSETSATIQAKDKGQSLNYINPVFVAEKTEYIVRRLTPLECERLQGLPDNWTDIGEWVDEKGKPRKESSDSSRYKAIGNGIALPPWEYVLQRLSLCCGGDTTMGSLFDGIGGFPLIWERLNGRGSCIWASEIEEFPIAVTKRRFDEVQNG